MKLCPGKTFAPPPQPPEYNATKQYIYSLKTVKKNQNIALKGSGNGIFHVLLLLWFYYPSSLWACEYCNHQRLSIYLSIRPHFQSMHYFSNAQVKKGDMLPSYAPWGGLQAYQRGVTMTNYVWVKIGKKLRHFLDGVNTLSHVCPLVVAQKPIEGELPGLIFGCENWKNLLNFLQGTKALSHHRLG